MFYATCGYTDFSQLYFNVNLLRVVIKENRIERATYKTLDAGYSGIWEHTGRQFINVFITWMSSGHSLWFLISILEKELE